LHQIAELQRKRVELTRVDLLQLGEAHPAETGKYLGHCSLEFYGGGGWQQHPHLTDAIHHSHAVAGCGRDDQLAKTLT